MFEIDFRCQFTFYENGECFLGEPLAGIINITPGTRVIYEMPHIDPNFAYI